MINNITEDIEHEVVSEGSQTTPHESATFDVTQTIDEEVIVTDVKQNNTVNQTDFEDAVDEDPVVKVTEEKKAEVKKEDPPVGSKDNPLAHGEKDAKDKQGAVTRLMKPDVLMHTLNSGLRRTGKLINEKNPDFLVFDKEDKEDIGILLTETVAEENWKGTPTKWLLIIMVGLVLIGKIFSWNKPKAIAVEAKNTESENKLLLQMQQNFEKLEAQQKLLTEQNDMLRALLDKQISGKAPLHTVEKNTGMPKIYKGYDLSKISFTENGALIDPSKAGQKGYTDQGKKQGIPSDEIKDVKKQWQLYNEYYKEEAA